MVLGKLETIYSMLLFEKRAFLLYYRAKVVLLQHIPDCLRNNRVRSNVVDKFGGLNSIVQPSSSDLTNDGLFIAMSELGRMPSFVVFLVPIYFPFDPSNGRPS